MTVMIEALNPQGFIQRCQAMMFNKMQCPRGSSYSVDGVQYCTFHARVLQQEQLNEMNKEPKEDENGVLIDDVNSSAATGESSSDGTTS
jgi:hypothetical protein